MAKPSRTMACPDSRRRSSCTTSRRTTATTCEPSLPRNTGLLRPIGRGKSTSSNRPETTRRSNVRQTASQISPSAKIGAGMFHAKVADHQLARLRYLGHTQLRFRDGSRKANCDMVFRMRVRLIGNGFGRGRRCWMQIWPSGRAQKRDSNSAEDSPLQMAFASESGKSASANMETSSETDPCKIAGDTLIFNARRYPNPVKYSFRTGNLNARQWRPTETLDRISVSLASVSILTLPSPLVLLGSLRDNITATLARKQRSRCYGEQSVANGFIPAVARGQCLGNVGLVRHRRVRHVLLHVLLPQAVCGLQV